MVFLTARRPREGDLHESEPTPEAASVVKLGERWNVGGRFRVRTRWTPPDRSRPWRRP